MYCMNCEYFCQNIVLCDQCLRIFFWNLAILFSNSSLGSEKLNQNRHSLIKSRLTDLNNFIRKRVTAKSNDFTSLLFNGQHSKPHNKIGKHLHLTNSRTTSSEAALPIFPKIALVARKNPRLASSNEHLSDLNLTFYLFFSFTSFWKSLFTRNGSNKNNKKRNENFLSHFSLYYCHLLSLTSISVIIYICWSYESSISMRQIGRYDFLIFC